MILILIGALMSILIPVLIYKWILNGQEISKKLYIKIFILGATLYTLPIIILEQTWDVFFKHNSLPLIANYFAVSFLRAALLEEAVKFFFSYRVLKRNKDLGMKEAILLAGLVGVGYGFTEKLAYGSGVAIILNALVQGHMLFQWIMGWHIYKALQTEGQEKRKLLLRAYFIPFVVHGLWDFSLDLLDIPLEQSIVLGVITFFIMLAMVIAVTVATIRMAIRIRRI